MMIHWPASAAPRNKKYFEMNPTVGGSPTIDMAPMTKAPIVQGICRPMPPNSLTAVRWLAR